MLVLLWAETIETASAAKAAMMDFILGHKWRKKRRERRLGNCVQSFTNCWPLYTLQKMTETLQIVRISGGPTPCYGGVRFIDGSGLHLPIVSNQTSSKYSVIVSQTIIGHLLVLFPQLCTILTFCLSFCANDRRKRKQLKCTGLPTSLLHFSASTWLGKCSIFGKGDTRDDILIRNQTYPES